MQTSRSMLPRSRVRTALRAFCSISSAQNARSFTMPARPRLLTPTRPPLEVRRPRSVTTYRTYSSAPRQCWSCSAPVQPAAALCPSCSRVQPAPAGSYFDLLNGGTEEFSDAPGTALSELKQRFLKLQQAVHPDQFGQAEDRERRYAEDMSALANKAYQTLRDPELRALYILERHGLPIEEQDSEAGSGAPPDLLMSVLETMEELQDATDQAVVDRIRDENQARIGETTTRMEDAFARSDWEDFRRGAIELRFWNNIRAACDGWTGGGARVELMH
ncbi:hypothetical protein DFJ74DRAFT_649871 [Hyaloraphidium curvatum]|nr:hypothetical protein DFJ74DRAFT_649871 [Hyaloraphidium curvatum]